jgi:hypothetical protein
MRGSTAKAPPDGERVVARGRKRVLGGEAVRGGQGAQASCAPGLGHQSTVADNRTRTIAAAVEIDEDAGSVRPRRDRPFAIDSIEIDRLEFDIIGDRPDGADLLDPPPAFLPAHRPRLTAQESADGVNFALRHG